MNATGGNAWAVGLETAEAGHAGNSPVEVRDVGGYKGVFAREAVERTPDRCPRRGSRRHQSSQIDADSEALWHQ